MIHLNVSFFPKCRNQNLNFIKFSINYAYESHLHFALSSSYLPATLLRSGFVYAADLSLLPLQVMQLPLGLLQLLSSLRSFTLQRSNLIAILLVQSLGILT